MSFIDLFNYKNTVQVMWADFGMPVGYYCVNSHGSVLHTFSGTCKKIR